MVKDDGLAAGKGVVVTDDRAEALAHARACLAHGDDAQVVVEEFLDGPEVSLFCVTDGASVVPLEPAQDFKRLRDDDAGPNTGGMGAYSPLPWAPTHLARRDVVERVAQPTVDAMARRGTPFAGLLYVGLAMTSRGPRVVEFNARFGDPETQVVLARLESPLGGLLRAAATGDLAGHPPLRWSDAGGRDRRPGQPRLPGVPDDRWRAARAGRGRRRAGRVTCCTPAPPRAATTSSRPADGCSRSSASEPTWTAPAPSRTTR